MHKLNVQILGPTSFVSTLNELKAFLKFNPVVDKLDKNPNVVLFHVDVLKDKKQKEHINKTGTWNRYLYISIYLFLLIGLQSDETALRHLICEPHHCTPLRSQIQMRKCMYLKRLIQI